METLVITMLEYGTTPALLVLTAMVGWLIKKINDNTKADNERAAGIQKTLKEHSEILSDHSERMTSIEQEYLKRETHYKDIGGWRTDLDSLRKDINDEFRAVRSDMSAFNNNLLKAAMEGVKHGAKG